VVESFALSNSILVHSPSTIFNQTRINPNNKTHTSISHLLNQILIDGVEEVNLVRPKNIVTQNATTNYSALFSLIDAS
jgi:hypothetical protein